MGDFAIRCPKLGATLRDLHIIERELQDFLVQIEQVFNVVLVRTSSGYAQSVCEAIDRIGWAEVAGTLAGENTIFIITRSEQDAAALVYKINAVCGEEQ